jgi:hypothetical protein
LDLLGAFEDVVTARRMRIEDWLADLGGIGRRLAKPSELDETMV